MDGANVSEGIYELLMLAGIDAGKPASRLATDKRKGRTAIRRNARIKARRGAQDAQPGSEADAGGKQQPTGAEGGQRGPIYLAWVNTAMRQGTRRRTGVPFLMIVR